MKYFTTKARANRLQVKLAGLLSKKEILEHVVHKCDHTQYDRDELITTAIAIAKIKTRLTQLTT